MQPVQDCSSYTPTTISVAWPNEKCLKAHNRAEAQFVDTIAQSGYAEKLEISYISLST